MTVLPVPDEDILAQASAEAADAKDGWRVGERGWSTWRFHVGEDDPVTVLTRPDGRKETLSLGGPTHWDTDSLGNFFASWPYVGGWGPESKQGLLVDFFPLRPGTYLATK